MLISRDVRRVHDTCGDAMEVNTWTYVRFRCFYRNMRCKGLFPKNGGSPYEPANTIVLKIGTPQKRHLTFGKLHLGTCQDLLEPVAMSGLVVSRFGSFP